MTVKRFVITLKSLESYMYSSIYCRSIIQMLLPQGIATSWNLASSLAQVCSSC